MTHALFTSCNTAYLPGALALLQSAARHHPDIPRYCMVMPEDQVEAERVLDGLATVLTAPRAIRGIPPPMQVCVLKLFAPLVPVDWVVYVDADAIFCRPAPELWKVQPGMVVGVATGPRIVLNSVPWNLQAAFLKQFPDIAHGPCFNGGLFALAPAEWRDLPERYEAVLEAGHYPAYHPIMDQPLLNGVFQGKIEWLPMQFNVSNLFDTPIPRDTRILHFTGGKTKPWTATYPRHEPQYHWWLKHGLGETDPWRLLLSWLRIAVYTPKRLLGRAYRRWQGRRTG
jgi:hypothetical protein